MRLLPRTLLLHEVALRAPVLLLSAESGRTPGQHYGGLLYYT